MLGRPRKYTFGPKLCRLHKYISMFYHAIYSQNLKDIAMYPSSRCHVKLKCSAHYDPETVKSEYTPVVHRASR